MLIKKACDMLDSWFVWLYRIRPEEPLVGKNKVFDDIRRALTHFLIEEVAQDRARKLKTAGKWDRSDWSLQI
jgi:hypothetical protein